MQLANVRKKCWKGMILLDGKGKKQICENHCCLCSRLILELRGNHLHFNKKKSPLP